MVTEKKPKCCLCGRECENEYGNNPWPLAEHGRCCDRCNDKVTAVRLSKATGEDPAILEEVLRGAREKAMEVLKAMKAKGTDESPELVCPYCGAIGIPADEDEYMEYTICECPKCDNRFYVSNFEDKILKAEDFGNSK